MNNNYRGVQRRNSSCNQQQFDPYMFGGSRGFGVGNSQMAPAFSINTMSQPGYAAPTRTSSQRDNSVQNCMQWPTSLNSQRNYANQPMYSSGTRGFSRASMSSPGDAQFCTAPPKVYISAADGQTGKQIQRQSLPCQLAPIGTDPLSLIQPMQPLTVRVQAPSDLFTGEPKTISISSAQLYGGQQ